MSLFYSFVQRIKAGVHLARQPGFDAKRLKWRYIQYIHEVGLGPITECKPQNVNGSLN